MTRLLDAAAIAACLVYVDLNPIRAGIAPTPEESQFTSVYERIRAAVESCAVPSSTMESTGVDLPATGTMAPAPLQAIVATTADTAAGEFAHDRSKISLCQGFDLACSSATQAAQFKVTPAEPAKSLVERESRVRQLASFRDNSQYAFISVSAGLRG